MRIKIQQFLGQRHSWSVFGWGIATSLIKLGHQVDLFPTDGLEYLPPKLRKNVIGWTELNKPYTIHGKRPDQNYDCQISYTCMKNFPAYLSSSNKNRFGMWIYEWDKLPNGFAKSHLSCDKLLSPSSWGKQIFMEAGIPEEKIVVLPHGINIEEYQGSDTIDLGTKKSFRVLANLAQLHKRKNITGLLEAWGKAFSKSDDVCLILKAKFKEPQQPFDVNLKDCLADFNRKYPNHAEVKIYQDFMEDISALYRSVSATFTMSHCEGFYFPALEGISSGKIAISPRHGGQLDFLNNDNALLIDGKIGRADPTEMYWSSHPNATHFNPSVDDAVSKLRYAYEHYQELNAKLELNRSRILEQYSWDTITNQLLSLCV